MKKFLTLILLLSFLTVPTQKVFAAATVIFLTDTGATTWTVPSDWNSARNTIEVIGGGAGGSLGLLGPEFYSVGGGGGAYSKAVNLNIVSGSTVGIQVGGGGAVANNGEDTWICSSTSNCGSINGSAVIVGAKAGTLVSTGGVGGSAASSIGTVKYNGGDGAIASATFAGAGGGGGAAGPNGNGADGGLGSGSAGDGGGGGGNGGGYVGADSVSNNSGAGGNNYSNTSGGAAGTAFGNGGDGTEGAGGGGGDYLGLSSGDGGNGTEWDATHGSGGGGGGGPGANQTNPYDRNYGGKGGLYGGGGGGSPMGTVNSGDFAGAQGIIVITYYPRSVISRPSNNLGLTGHWSFNEGSGTVAHDFSGNGYASTLQNGPLWSNGRFGKGLTFDGVDDYISTSLTNVNYSSGSVSWWQKPGTAHDAGTSRAIWGQLLISGEDEQGLDCQVSGTNNWSCGWHSSSGDARVTLAASALNYPRDVWSHYTLVWTSGGTTLYMNGVSIGTDVDNPNVSDLGEAFELGRLSGFSNTYFPGSLDDFRIYNRALSLSEVLALYKIGATIIGGGEKTKVTNGLVGHWTFNGNDVNWTSGTAGTAYDRSGQGNDAILSNMNQSTSVTSGKLGQALSFVSGNSQYGTTPSIVLPETFSISTWVNPTNQLIDYPRIAESDYSTGFYLGLDTMDDPGYKWIVKGTAVPFGTAEGGTLTFGKWTHVVGTYDGTNGALYVDGVLVGSSVFTSPGAVSKVVGIGRNPNALGEFFNGKIDDVRLYNRTLSTSEIKQLYNLGGGTVIKR